jgi:hypothetical protein
MKSVGARRYGLILDDIRDTREIRADLLRLGLGVFAWHDMVIITSGAGLWLDPTSI